jgi:hypothetical protein
MKIVCKHNLITKLLTVSFILISIKGFAGFDADTSFIPVSSGEAYSLEIQKYPDLNYKILTYKAYITFSVGDIYELGIANKFDINVQFQMSESILYDAEYTVNLTEKFPEQVFVYDILSTPDELDFITVHLTDIVQNGTIATDVMNYIVNNLQLKIEYKPQFLIDVRETETSEALAPEISRLDEGLEISNRLQTFKWNSTATKEFPGYEFELLRLYNLDEATSVDSKVIKTSVNWSRALRIQLPSDQKFLTIAVTEGSGFYIWRVRPIGTFYEGGITDSRNYGAWSEAPEDTPEGELIDVSTAFASLYECIFYLNDPENDMNWIYSRVFTENNRLSESMVYANGLNQVKQSQTYLSSKDTTLITQSLTDYSGRPSMQTLPVPVAGKLGDYKESLVTSQNELYTAKQFDGSDTYKNPQTIDSSGYFEYYSDANTDLYIPTAEGYSFSRTIYENSPLGRMQEQSGPGKVHAIGRQTDGMGRTTRVIYTKPSDEELIRIFGDEALPAKAVLKTITIDANNTASVSYTSTSGNVIATCLIYTGEDDASLDNIDGYEDLITEPITEKIEKNFKTINGFVSDRRIVLSVPSKIKIKYNLPTGSASFGCTRIEADCEYIVSFTMRKIGTDSIWKSGDIFLSALSVTDTTWIPEDKEFTKGNYHIRKHIRSNASRLNPKVYGRIDESLDPVRNLSDVIHKWLDKVSTEKKMLLFHENLENFKRMVNTTEFDSIRAFPFNLSKVSLPDSAYQLTTTEGTNYLTINTSPVYDVKSGVFPEVISINGGCCGPVVIPVALSPQNICYTADEIRAEPELSPDFYTYLRTNLVEPFGEDLNISLTNEAGKTNVLYGYDSTSLNQMVYFMLTDKYYTGPVIYKGEDTLKADSTAIGPNDKKVQYTCSELWNCWKSVINSYIDIAANNYTDSLSTVDKGMNDDAAEDGSESQKDDHFDLGSGKFGGFLFKLFMKRKLSKRMKDAENIDDDGEGGTAVNFEFKLMEQFLNCAGFRFAGIVEKTGASTYTGILPEDLTKYYSYTNSSYFHDNMTAKTDSLFMPYIKNPMYAFKYYQYEEDLTITRTPSKKWLNAEVSACFDNYSAMVPPLCENNCGSRNHKNWNAYERLLFYNSIRVMKEPDFTDDGIDPPDLETKLDSVVRATFIQMRGSCSEKCNDMRQTIENQVIETFEENCYILNGCPADSNVVLDSDVQFIVNNILNQCVRDCDTLFEIASAMPDSFPKVIYPECQKVNYNGRAWETVSGEAYPMILPDNLMHEYNVIENWNFVFALDDAYSQCKYEDEFSSVILDEEWSSFDLDEWEYTQIYTDSNLVIKTSGTSRTNSVYFLRYDVADNFDFSVRIDSMITDGPGATSGFMVLSEENQLDNNFIQAGIVASGNFFMASDTTNLQMGPAVLSYPCYIRLKRTDNQFQAFCRYDTLSVWQNIGQIEMEIPYNPAFGLFVNSGGSPYINLTAFDNLFGGKKYPNRINDNNLWIGNTESSYPIYDEKGFPKKYSEDTDKELTIQP